MMKDMELKKGEKVYYRLMPNIARYNAMIVSMDEINIELLIDTQAPSHILNGQYILITGSDGDYYTEVIERKGDIIKLKQMWSEKRTYFRVDDVFPVIVRKMADNQPSLKSKIYSGYKVETYDEVPDTTVNPWISKILVDINNKLGLILEKLQFEQEGLASAENKYVNISASGIKFTTRENFEVGTCVEVKMLLPTYPPSEIITYGNISRANNLGNGEYEVALNYTEMDEEIRDEIIQYALKRQREILRRKRQQKGNDNL